MAFNSSASLAPKPLRSFLLRYGVLAFMGLGAVACGKDDDNGGGGGGGINIFSVEDDKDLGKQVSDEIESSGQYQVLDPAQYPAQYSYLNGIVNEILNSGELKYRDEFNWRVRIIKDDSTLNAFAAPAGYIYVYTGIIKFLESEDHFAGVMGHEIAHADERHVTEQMTKQYGLSVLLSIVAGNDSGIVTQIGSQLASLSFSRASETEADARSVAYLCNTKYASNGAAGFFAQLISMGQSGGPPEFLSTHPSPDNRVEDINAEAGELGCDTVASGTITSWRQFQNSLP